MMEMNTAMVFANEIFKRAKSEGCLLENIFTISKTLTIKREIVERRMQ